MTLIEAAKRDLGKKEKWKEIPDFKGYSISSFGNLKTENYNHTGNPTAIKTFKNVRGYMACNLMHAGIRKRKTIHQLVALAFIPNPRNLQQVNHKNGIKTDNNVENLEWCTGSENITHAFSNGLITVNKGEKHYAIKVTDEDVRDIRKLRSAGMKLLSIGKLYGVCFQTVSSICNKTARI